MCAFNICGNRKLSKFDHLRQSIPQVIEMYQGYKSCEHHHSEANTETTTRFLNYRGCFNTSYH